MKNITCPISPERIPEHIARLTAFFVLTLLVVYFINGKIFIPIVLSVDFFIRGFWGGKYSLLSFLSKEVSARLSIKSKLVDKAPKVFAARLGLVFSLLLLVLTFLDLHLSALVIAALFGFCAFLEFAFSFCVGCIVYSVVNPIFNRTV